MQKQLLMLPNAESADYGEQVDDILALLRGDYRSADGLEAHAIPGEGANVEIWILGSSGGRSVEVAGTNSLRFAANYHVSPATVLEAVDGYRAAFRPSAELEKPHIAVSADVVVADDEDTARRLAAGYGPWVLSIRNGSGAIPFPSPEEADAHVWSSEDRELVADRLDTQFVGTPKQAADQLRRLEQATGADELVITTITHDHADRVRSYELLARELANAPDPEPGRIGPGLGSDPRSHSFVVGNGAPSRGRRRRRLFLSRLSCGGYSAHVGVRDEGPAEGLATVDGDELVAFHLGEVAAQGGLDVPEVIEPYGRG